jgi:hypothetical protein
MPDALLSTKEDATFTQREEGMRQMRHPERPPDVPRLLAMLEEHDVRYVLIGSVAAHLYGVDVQPGDLDIVPALDIDNLRQLVLLLQAAEASIEGSEGHWESQTNGERKWIEVALTSEERAARAAAWRPQANAIATLDYSFHTRYGNFDVVPEVSGTYDTLMQRAVRMKAHEQIIWVAHVDDLLATVTVSRRAKDIPRVSALRTIQRHRATLVE